MEGTKNIKPKEMNSYKKSIIKDISIENHCLICNRKNGPPILLKSAHNFVSSSKTLLADFTSKVIGEEPYFTANEVLCMDCFRLLNCIDTYQVKVSQLISQLAEKYKKTKLELQSKKRPMTELITSSLSNISELQAGTILNVSDALTITVGFKGATKVSEHTNGFTNSISSTESAIDGVIAHSNSPELKHTLQSFLHGKRSHSSKSPKNKPKRHKNEDRQLVDELKSGYLMNNVNINYISNNIECVSNASNNNNNNNIDISYNIKLNEASICDIDSVKSDSYMSLHSNSQTMNNANHTNKHAVLGPKCVANKSNASSTCSNSSSSTSDSSSCSSSNSSSSSSSTSESSSDDSSDEESDSINKLGNNVSEDTAAKTKESLTNHKLNSELTVTTITSSKAKESNNETNIPTNVCKSTVTILPVGVQSRSIHLEPVNNKNLTLPSTKFKNFSPANDSTHSLGKTQEEVEQNGEHNDSIIDPHAMAEAALMNSHLASSLLQSFMSTSLWFNSTQQQTKKTKNNNDNNKTAKQTQQTQGSAYDDTSTVPSTITNVVSSMARDVRGKRRRQQLKNTGQSYVNTKGKLVQAKRVWPQDCSRCPLKCSSRLTESARSEAFCSYWALGDYSLQREYLAAHMHREERLGPSGLMRTVVLYFLTHNHDKIQVCRQFFLKTLDVSEKASRIVLEKKVKGELGVDEAICAQVKAEDDDN